MAQVTRAIVEHVTDLTRGRALEADDPLPGLRWTLSRTVANHCSAEVELLRDHLQRNPQIGIDRADMVRRYHDELLAWRSALMECNADWPPKRVTQEPSGFLDVFRPLADALYQRIRWEEHEFYPKVLGRT
ncbi:hypothetical protein GCM10010833_10920 [Blastomonas aquatica]|uniref:Hemerythrin-like domain-containing protein n=2 Tax=Blastomonas aquatica TaxID=1510276 RepID=A0ABQ1J4Z5_9SPHN|nr:hypothetical protein GCM10010833_10920 [Blastomonas aquatica]